MKKKCIDKSREVIKNLLLSISENMVVDQQNKERAIELIEKYKIEGESDENIITLVIDQMSKTK